MRSSTTASPTDATGVPAVPSLSCSQTGHSCCGTTALTGVSSSNHTSSRASAEVLLMIGMFTTLVVSPGANTSVPLWRWKSGIELW